MATVPSEVDDPLDPNNSTKNTRKLENVSLRAYREWIYGSVTDLHYRLRNETISLRSRRNIKPNGRNRVFSR